MTHTLRLERRLGHSPETVFRALVEPRHLSQWYPLTALDRPRLFAFTEIDEEGMAHGFRVELSPEDGGCLLVLTHTFDDPTWRDRMAEGWRRCLDALEDLLGPADVTHGQAVPPDEPRLGTVDTVDGKPVLRFERRLAHSIATVWRAVTEPAQLSQWFPATVDFAAAIGAPVRFSFGEDSYDAGGEFADGEILELDPPKVFAFRWADSAIRIELVPHGDGCVLTFSHTLNGTDTTGDRPSIARQAPGWDACLGVLAARLDGREPSAVDGRWFLSRAAAYVACLGLGEGEALASDDGWRLWFERDLVANRDKVWQALTEDGEPVVGGAVPVRLTHGHLEAGLATSVRSGRMVEYEWCDEGKPAGLVRFELRDQRPVGTRLVVTQTVPGRQRDSRATALAAWQTHLELFFAALHGDVRCPWPEERMEELRGYYEGRLRSS